MNLPVYALWIAILIGLGATLTFDLWGLFLKHAFKIAPSDICLVGRWLLYMPEGIFIHSKIGSAPPKSAECPLGWIAHYLTGSAFAVAFITFAGNSWLQHPTPVCAALFGIATVAAPFLVLQPALGLGVAASKTADPWQARLRSLTNHTVFGLGLYLFGVLAAWLF